MKYLHTMLVMLTVALLGSATVNAEVPKPNIPKGNAEACVEDTQVMRERHMDFILHQRDDTMYKGIRTSKHSFKGCINCHAVNDESGKPVKVTDERHFCSTCHSYAAVTIDCFECHASTPTKKSGAKAHSQINSLTKAPGSGGNP